MRADYAKLKPRRIEGNEYPNYPVIALSYAERVRDGDIPACAYIRGACERFIRMHEKASARKGGMFFSDASVIEACAFVERMPHIEGNWDSPTIVLEPWQIFKTAAIFGFRWLDTGYRVVRTVYIEEPRKHGKTLYTAAIAMYAQCFDGEMGPDIYIGGPKRDQARKVFNPMRRMYERANGLLDRFSVETTNETIRLNAIDGNVYMLSSVGEREDGHNPFIIVLDEMHAQRPDLVKVMRSSQRSRENGLFIMIGSGGRHAFGAGWDERQTAIKVATGVMKADYYFALIYTIDRGDERNWRDEKVIAKANPNLGVSVSKRVVMQEADQARTSPAEKAEFLRTALNIWGRNENALIAPDDWARCADHHLRIEHFAGMPAYIGVDLSGRNDMTAVTTVIHLPAEVEGGEDQIVMFARHYLPSDAPWRQDEDLSAVYSDWANEQQDDENRTWLTLIPGTRTNYERVESDIVSLGQLLDVRGVGVDAWQANDLMGRLKNDHRMKVDEYPQRARFLHEPTDDILARVQGAAGRVAAGKERGLLHDGNPILQWNAQNVVSGKDTNENLFPKKAQRGSTQKIDGFIAGVFANGLRLGTLKQRTTTTKEPIVISEVRQFSV